MIVRPSPGANVCLGCCIRLSRRQAVRVFPQPSLGIRWQHNDFEELKGDSNPSSPSEGTSELGNELESYQSTSLNARSHDFPKTAHSRSFRRPLEKPRLSAHPLGRLYGARGYKLRERTEKLQTESLGRPAEVLILRDAGVRLTHPRPREENEAEKFEAVDILAELDNERGLIGEKDVRRNLDNLKPNDTVELSWDEFQNLEKQLTRGFTTHQLSRYMDNYKEPIEQEKSAEYNAPVGNYKASVTKKTAWVPGTSSRSDSFEVNSLRGYLSESFTPKQRLVVQLLRQCWKIEVQEVTESIGKMEIEVSGIELELLIGPKGSQAPLKIISDSFISNDEEKIEAFRSRRVIRITANKEKAKLIANEIDNVLGLTHTIEVDLNPLGLKEGIGKRDRRRPHYTDEALSEISRLTNTEIRKLSKNRLSISSINRKPDTNLSTPSHIARRLLLSTSPISEQISRQLSCKATNGPLIPVPLGTTQSMSWHDQLRSWVRLISPSSKLESSEDFSSSIARQINTPGSVLLGIGANLLAPKAFKHRQQEQSPNADTRYSTETSKSTLGSEEASTHSSALVGRVLYESSETFRALHPLGLDATHHHHSTFLPASLNFSRLVGLMNAPVHLPTTSLLMKFIPSPWTLNEANAGKYFPRLELQFAVDASTKGLNLEKVLATTESLASDVMIPDQSLDLRFQQVTTITLNSPKVLTQVSKFLDESQLNLIRGTLATPPDLKIAIPSYLCGEPLSSASDTISVDYIFAGLEYRNSFSYSFRDWMLSYTSIEGGKADGRRSELALYPQNLHAEAERQPEDFIEAAFALVDTLENGGTPPLQLKTPILPNLESPVGEYEEFEFFSHPLVLEASRDSENMGKQ